MSTLSVLVTGVLFSEPSIEKIDILADKLPYKGHASYWSVRTPACAYERGDGAAVLERRAASAQGAVWHPR